MVGPRGAPANKELMYLSLILAFTVIFYIFWQINERYAFPTHPALVILASAVWRQGQPGPPARCLATKDPTDGCAAASRSGRGVAAAHGTAFD